MVRRCNEPSRTAMTFLSHTADDAGHALSLPRHVPLHGSQRRSLLDRIDSPRAVFAMLGTAAVIGLALAFAVLHGLARLDNTLSEQHAVNGSAKLEARHANPAPPSNPALAQ